MNWKHLLVGTAAVSLLAACSSTKPPETNTSAASASQPAAPVDSASTKSAQTPVDPLNDPNSPLAQRSVYFDFDSSLVKDEYKPLISAHADYLKGNAAHKITIQGNTDARGSREYNLALGQRRAESVKKAMEVLGVPDKQLEAVSFGKEKPKAEGNSDADYAQNRRDDIVYDGQ
ncbi:MULTISPECIES: peptidoglycan-associated lipoprotein Pal [unclassified Paludibacterium]|uniref:peptidoglycan-associated lipoprotein Pal n=1 Tax=unclassified Paludibacterium TaxID=2618429 RepID=UPI001C047367|nr:peptidoglycan-associated lipoprotein Pal [Paludibacterium sp. B53371]BEV72449.1 peptidoglycan-associated lipoprotein Pal [Paludibacterium sp. THUN1379]